MHTIIIYVCLSIITIAKQQHQLQICIILCKTTIHSFQMHHEQNNPTRVIVIIDTAVNRHQLSALFPLKTLITNDGTFLSMVLILYDTENDVLSYFAVKICKLGTQKQIKIWIMPSNWHLQNEHGCSCSAISNMIVQKSTHRWNLMNNGTVQTNLPDFECNWVDNGWLDDLFAGEDAPRNSNRLTCITICVVCLTLQESIKCTNLKHLLFTQIVQLS